MSTYINKLSILLSLVVILICSSCGDKQKEFNKLIDTLGKNDKVVDSEELQLLKKFLNTHRNYRAFEIFFPDGNFLEESLIIYIEQRGYSIQEEEPIVSAINIYIENSGSMNGYVNGSTEFKDDLREFLVSIKNYYGEDKVKLFFINSDIHQTGIQGDLVNIPSKLNPSSMKVGQTSSSELNKIFSLVLAQTSKDTISVLLSDCIYSIGKGDVKGLLTQQKTLTKDAFLTKFKNIKDISTVFVKLNSVFKGVYYDKNNNSVNLANGMKRPYYLTIIGGSNALADLNQKIEPSKALKYGYEHKYTLTSKDFSHDFFSMVVKADGDVGTWNYSKGVTNGIQNVRTSDRRGGSFTFSVAVDFSKIPVEEDYLVKPENYDIKRGRYELLDILPYKKDELKQQSILRIDKLGAVPTHRLVFQATAKNQTDLVFSLKKKTVDWVEKAHSDDDTDVSSQLDKTFGFRYLVEGIEEAYQTISKSPEDYFEMTININ